MLHKCSQSPDHTPSASSALGDRTRGHYELAHELRMPARTNTVHVMTSRRVKPLIWTLGCSPPPTVTTLAMTSQHPRKHSGRCIYCKPHGLLGSGGHGCLGF